MTPVQRMEALQAGEQAALAMEQLPFGAVRQSIMEAWQKSESADSREQLWHEIKALDRVTGKLWTMINGAKIAAHEIKAEETAQTRKADPYERA